MIFDPVADRYFRISEKEHYIISQFNSDKEIDKVSELLTDAGIEISIEDVAATTQFLNQNNLLLPVYYITEKKLNMLKIFKRKMLPTRLMSSYLFIKIPLFKPDVLLSKTITHIKTIFNKWTFLFLAIISLIGYIQLVSRWDKVIAIVLQSFTFAGMTRYVSTIIILKLFHEFSHAYVAKALGVRVRRMGVSFILFFPRFYTDVTDSWRIPDRRKRVYIDVAGIACEVLIGGFAALVWTNSGPGILNTIAYYVFAVSITNTVLVNGNPFIRYDGYYLLMDLTGIDNLQKRGITAAVVFLRKCILGIDDTPRGRKTPKDRFLIFYGISAFIYRLFLYTSIILIIYLKFIKVIGIILMILEVYILIIKPLINEIRTVMKMKQRIKRTNLTVSILLLGAILLIFLIPLPWNISMPGEVKAKELYVVRARNQGFLLRIHADDQDEIEAGTGLVEQQNPFLEFEAKQKQLELVLAETELDQLLGDSQTIALGKLKQQQLEAQKKSLANIKREESRLSIESSFPGYFLYNKELLHKGKWLKKGEIIGELYNPKKQLIYAYAKEEYIDKLKVGDKVTFFIHSELKGFSGSVISVNSVASKKMLGPSPLLTSFGGHINVIPQNQFILEEPHYKVVIEPTSEIPMHIGRTGTVYIRKYTSVAVNIFRKVSNLYHREFAF
jgi:putative peptide zinc metalloprotease protein